MAGAAGGREEFCGDFRRGICTRGDRCRFSAGNQWGSTICRSSPFDDCSMMAESTETVVRCDCGHVQVACMWRRASTGSPRDAATLRDVPPRFSHGAAADGAGAASTAPSASAALVDLGPGGGLCGGASRESRQRTASYLLYSMLCI